MKNSYHVSLDLETLDTKPTSHIISIGACIFSFKENRIIGERVWFIDWEDQPGRTISADTVQWWIGQKNKEDIVENNRVPLGTALIGLKQLFEQYVGLVPWGNGSTFDISILENAYSNINNYACPWLFWAARDMRTLVALAKDKGFNPKEVLRDETIKHGALPDAVHQANVMLAAYKTLMS